MKNDGSDNILDDFRCLQDFSAFEAFARALWDHQAAVMVGAGFSRLCDRDAGSPMPPLWKTFKTVMEKELGYAAGTAPDALRLAQEYRTLHGENGMDQLIQRLIPDLQWEPGSLHKKLLEMPWRDVLTTNWDTLLERTKLETPDRIYSRVCTVQDIAHQPRPRIVKLHGTLPSHKPFVFTEDDYRTYPNRFGPFVNLAQQVMLEHDLCLIGFSGDDPNFLAWSGWVRDTLDVSARRIRLVGVLGLSAVSRALLQQRNVTPIDLEPLVRDVHPDEKHEKALELFFRALSASRPRSPYRWELGSERFSWSHRMEEEEKPTRREVAAASAKDRQSYPGWIVAPSGEARKLGFGFVKFRADEETAGDHLRLALERIWRHRTARFWLSQFDMLDADKHYEAGSAILSCEERILLCSAMTAQLRLTQEWSAWSRWMERLHSIGGTEASDYHAYETGLRAILNWDDDATLDAAYAIKSDQPIWRMRKASLLANAFSYKESAECYQAALLVVRQKLLSSPKSAWLISLEAWASLFHRVSSSALTGERFSFPSEESDETRMRYMAARSDPWDMITNLERLASERFERNRDDSELWKLSFQSGQYTRGGTTRIGGESECPFYSLVHLIELTGAPTQTAGFNLFSTRLENAYRAMTAPGEKDLLYFLAKYRGSEKKILDRIIPRMKVAVLSDDAVQHLLSVVRARIDCLISVTGWRREDNYIDFLLELMARIVVRTTSSNALEIFRWLIDALNSSVMPWVAYRACSAALEGALEAMEVTQRQDAISLALELKLPVEASAQGIELHWPELMGSFSESDVQGFRISSIAVRRIDGLIVFAKNGGKLDRGRAISRLHIMHRAGKLTEGQVALLEEAIWSKVSESGWPADTELFPWVFLELPGRARAERLFLDNVVEAVTRGRINRDTLLNLRAGMERTSTHVSQDAILSCIRNCLNWTPESDPGVGMDGTPFWDMEGQVRSTAREIGEVLARTLLPRVEANDIPDDVRLLLNGAHRLGHIPSAAAMAYQIARLWPDLQRQASAQIRYAMASREPSRVYPAFIAVKQLVENSPVETDLHVEIKEFLLHACEQRTQPGLSSTLNILADMFERSLLKEDELKRVSSALEHILSEYRYDQKNLEVPSKAELPTVRRAVYRLSKLLLPMCSELADLNRELAADPLPEVRLLS